MESDGPRAVVIGSGMGGLACAARLVTRGVQVTLLEAGHGPGGKVGGDRWDGFTVDFVPHMFSMSSGGEIARVARILGEPLQFIVKDPVARVSLGNRVFEFPGRFESVLDAAKLVRGVGVRKRAIPGAARHFLELYRGGPAFDRGEADCTLREWGKRYTADPTYLNLLNLLSLLAFVIPYDQGSAREMAHCFARIVRGAGIGYPRGGCLGMVEMLANGIRRHGGTIRYGCRVDRIETDGGRVTGVVAGGERFPADVVFCNGGIQRTVALVGEEHLDETYVRKAGALTNSLAGVGIRYTLDEAVVPYPVLFSMPGGHPDDVCARIHGDRLHGLSNGFYVTVPSNFDPGLAPPGKQVVIAGTLFYSEVDRQQDAERMLVGLEHRMERLFPRLPHVILRREISAQAEIARASGRGHTGESVGIAQTPGQSGEQRPSFRTPIRGLYVVGADTGTGAIGTELAAASGLQAAEYSLLMDRTRP